MSVKPETKFRLKVVKDLKTLANVAVFSIQQKTIKGDPDLLLCVNGFFVALELKSEKGEASKLQLLKLTQINNAGGYAYLVYPDNWREIFQVIQFLSEGAINNERH